MLPRRLTYTCSTLAVLGFLASGCAERPVISPAAVAPSALPTQVYGLRSATVDYLTASTGSPTGMPIGAKPGECYVQAVVPAQYETVSERVVKKAAATRVDVTPAQYQEVEERVMVRPATTRLEAVPPTFEDVEERMLVRAATTKIEPVPATFRTVSEQVLVRPAYTIWKRSSELTTAERAQQGVDPTTAGDILCLVDVPAEYRTVTSEVIANPATTRETEIPAEYTMVRKTVLKTPASTRTIEVPAEYRVVKVTKMVSPAREAKVEIPAEYDTVSRQVLKSAATTEWREILCETNATSPMLVSLQESLKRSGFDPGRTDGRYDAATVKAVRAFQQAKGLPVDGDRYINMATVKALTSAR